MDNQKLPNEIIKKSVTHYMTVFGASLLQFLMVICYLGIGFMIIFTVKTVAFPDMVIGANIEFIGFCAFSAILIGVMFLIMTPYIYGGIWYSTSAAEVKIVPSNVLFGCYNDFDRIRKVLKLEFALTARKLPVFIPIAVISVMNIFLTVNIIDFTAGLMPVFAAAGCTLSVFGLFMLYKVYALRFFPARHIFVENPDIPANEIIARARAMTKGKSNLLAALYLRLLPMYMFSLLVLPALFVMPISISCYCYLYKSIS
ncbi:MAG: hypothetical protein LBM59_07045 [Ruminococcus sp.]|jgi:uncharacterized membrane protein|nr:hypothetical protein [Ruminococcus sp.]